MKVSEVVDSFYSFLELPRLDSALAVKRAIARGVAEGRVAYVTAPPPRVLIKEKVRR